MYKQIQEKDWANKCPFCDSTVRLNKGKVSLGGIATGIGFWCPDCKNYYDLVPDYDKW